MADRISKILGVGLLVASVLLFVGVKKPAPPAPATPRVQPRPAPEPVPAPQPAPKPGPH